MRTSRAGLAGCPLDSILPSSQARAAIARVLKNRASTGNALAEAHDAATAEARLAKSGEQLAESASRTNLGFNTAGKIGSVAGPVLTAVAIGVAVKNVADAPPGQKMATAGKEGGGIGGAIGGGELGAELLSPVAPPYGAIGGGIIGSIIGGLAGKKAIETILNSGSDNSQQMHDMAVVTP
jgi:hypothetical protein